jgi:hypothetical protein
MADLTKLTSDLDIISMLDNEPNDVGGLTAEELKAKFDEGANLIKQYINEVLIPELASEIGAANIGITRVPGITGAEDVQTALEKLETQMGDITQGAVADSSITTAKLADLAVTTAKLADACITLEKLADGIVTSDKLADLAVITAKIADTAITGAKIADKAVIRRCIGDKAVGTSQLGTAAVGSDQIDDNAVLTRCLAVGAVTVAKVNSDARTQRWEVSVSTTWTGDAAPYTQSIAVSGMLATDVPKVYKIAPASVSDVDDYDEEFSKLYHVESSAGSITLYAKEQTTAGITVAVEVNRI